MQQFVSEIFYRQKYPDLRYVVHQAKINCYNYTAFSAFQGCILKLMLCKDQGGGGLTKDQGLCYHL